MPTVEGIRASDPVWNAAHALVDAIAASGLRPGSYHSLKHLPSGFDIQVQMGPTRGSMEVRVVTYDIERSRRPR